MYSYFSGFANKDVAFNHIESKSLIVADLIFNLPAREQYSKSKGSIVQGIFGGFGSLNPYSWGHKKFVTTLGKDKEYVNVGWAFVYRVDTTFFSKKNIRAMMRDAKTVDGWDFTRIIPCHGVSVSLYLYVFTDDIFCLGCY